MTELQVMPFADWLRLHPEIVTETTKACASCDSTGRCQRSSCDRSHRCGQCDGKGQRNDARKIYDAQKADDLLRREQYLKYAA